MWDHKRLLLILVCCIPIVLSYQNCAPLPQTSANNNNSGIYGNGGDGSPGTGIGGTDVNDQSQLSEGQRYFVEKLIPLFEQQTQCFSCHSAPRFGGTAPLSIYNYNQMIFKLATGNSTIDNDLMNKVQANVSHTGGNRCLLGLGESPCKDLIEWRQIEFPLDVEGINGAITNISITGRVTGWIYDAQQSNTIFDAHIYADGPVGVGTLLATVPANEIGPGGLTAGHYFFYTLPASFANGQPHDLYVYGDQAISDNLLPGMPYNSTAYTPTAAGRNFYDATLGPQLASSCTGCHDNSYEGRYPSLVSPSPFSGGSASNNDLVIKASGGASHGGGSFCNGVGNGLCADIQQWWNLEFGN